MSVAPPVKTAGGIDTFNINHGFAEAVVRGFRSGFLLSHDYDSLVQCDTLEDMKMNLAETDYDQFLANEQVGKERDTYLCILHVCIQGYIYVYVHIGQEGYKTIYI